jgi:hypothetical protein
MASLVLALSASAGCGASALDVRYPEAGSHRALLASGAPGVIEIRRVIDRRRETKGIGTTQDDGDIVTTRPVVDIVHEALVVEFRKNGYVIGAEGRDAVVSTDVEEFWLDRLTGYSKIQNVGKVTVAVVVTDGRTGEGLLRRRYVGIKRREVDKPSDAVARAVMDAALARTIRDMATDLELAAALVRSRAPGARLRGVLRRLSVAAEPQPIGEGGNEHRGHHPAQHRGHHFLPELLLPDEPSVADGEPDKHPQGAPHAGPDDVGDRVAEIRHSALGGEGSDEDPHACHEAGDDDGGGAETAQVLSRPVGAFGAHKRHQPAIQLDETVASEAADDVPDMIAEHGAHHRHSDEKHGTDGAGGSQSPGGDEEEATRKGGAGRIDECADEYHGVGVAGEELPHRVERDHTATTVPGSAREARRSAIAPRWL